MALEFNGSNNTISGLAVGGLPDNVIDKGCMADDSVGPAELHATSGTAGAGTFFRGDGTWQAAGGGKILKVQSTQTGSNLNSTNTSYTHWGNLDVAYTPTASDSTLFIVLQTNLNGWDANVSDAPIAYIALSKDGGSNYLYEGGVTCQASGGSVTGVELSVSFTNIFSESAANTNARTYALYYKLGRGTSMQINQWSNSTSSLTVVEVGA